MMAPKPSPADPTALSVPRATPEELALLMDVIASSFRSPGKALRDNLNSGALAEALKTLAEGRSIEVPEFSDLDWSRLRSSYVALFVSSGHGIAAPPYAGFALDGELLGPSVEGFKAFLAHHGVEITATWADLPDHIAAIAEAGALLARADRTEAARLLLGDFLAPWFWRYHDAVVAADASGFYGPLTTFVNSYLREVAHPDAA
jgi:TorA maturation chaperone TorD